MLLLARSSSSSSLYVEDGGRPVRAMAVMAVGVGMLFDEVGGGGAGEVTPDDEEADGVVDGGAGRSAATRGGPATARL
jgi:hypothetical protein